jgi:trigger factor
VQVDFEAINAVSKKITITVPAEDAEKAWQKYLRKAARSVDVPGFRKGKAPLTMIERMYKDTLNEHFLKDSVSDYFDQAAREHDISYLLFPDVKDMQWEKGGDMTFEIEIEHEPTLEFKQLDNLDVPFNPITLDSEIDKYLEELRQSNARTLDMEEAAENDFVEAELTISPGEQKLVKNAYFYAGSEPERRAIPELIGKKIGDTLSTKLLGANIKLVCQDASLDLDNEESYPVSIMVNAVTRMQLPELNDDFARDMEFDDMTAMRSKIAEDMSLANEHKNLDVKNYAIVSKLFVDNQFDLPMKTIDYLATQEAEKYPQKEYQQYLQYQYRMQISQEMVTIYILNNLRRVMDLNITDAMIEEYIIHEAILSENTAEAYKEQHKDEIASDDYKNGVKNYFILRKLAETANFFVPEPEAEPEQIPEAEATEVDSEESQAQTAADLKQKATPQA